MASEETLCITVSIEKLTILAGQVTICAKILLMPCGVCIGVLLSRLILSSTSCVRRWLLSFKIPVIYKIINLLVYVCIVGMLVIILI